MFLESREGYWKLQRKKVIILIIYQDYNINLNLQIITFFRWDPEHCCHQHGDWKLKKSCHVSHNLCTKVIFTVIIFNATIFIQIFNYFITMESIQLTSYTTPTQHFNYCDSCREALLPIQKQKTLWCPGHRYAPLRQQKTDFPDQTSNHHAKDFGILLLQRQNLLHLNIMISQTKVRKKCAWVHANAQNIENHSTWLWHSKVKVFMFKSLTPVSPPGRVW